MLGLLFYFWFASFGTADLFRVCNNDKFLSVAGRVCCETACSYLDLGRCCEDNVVWVFQTVLFEPLRFGANEQVEMGGQVASQQGFVGRNVEQKGESFHIESRLQHLQNRQMKNRGARSKK